LFWGISYCGLIMLWLSSCGWFILTTSSCRIQYFDFQTSGGLFKQLQILCFPPRRRGCYCFFLQRKKSNQKKRRLVALPLRTPLKVLLCEGVLLAFEVTVRLFCPRGQPLVTPKCGIRAPKDWLVYSFIRLNISCEMCPAKQPSTVVVWLACCFFGIGVWLYTSWRPL